MANWGRVSQVSCFDIKTCLYGYVARNNDIGGLQNELVTSDPAADAALRSREDPLSALNRAASERDSADRRGDGHPDPVPQPRRDRLSRRALSRLRPRPAGQQRSSDPDPAAGDRGHPSRLCACRRRHPRDQHLFLDLDRPGRLRHARIWSTNSIATARDWRGGRRSTRKRRTDGAASSPARSGPTNRTASISPDVNNPGFRAVSFDELRIAYGEQIKRADRRRRGHSPHRDHFRHAERQGGDLRLHRGVRRARRVACR